jgi:hypothetical protein
MSESRIAELEARLEEAMKRNDALSNMLEDITLDADERREEYNAIMARTTDEIMKLKVKARMVSHLLCHIGRNNLPALGSWWTAFAAPILKAECTAHGEAKECFMCSKGRKRAEPSYSLTDLFCQEELEPDTKRSAVEVGV